MEDNFALIFDGLLMDLYKAFDRRPDAAGQNRAAYQAALKAWAALEVLVMRTPFASKDEEIAFFKWEKPQVTGLIEYFVLCAEAVVKLKLYPGDPLFFWERELHRGYKFFRDQASFCAYMEGGRTDEDDKWFTACADRQLARRYPRVYNRLAQSASAKDWQAARYCASRLYIQYVEDRIEELTIR